MTQGEQAGDMLPQEILKNLGLHTAMAILVLASSKLKKSEENLSGKRGNKGDS